MRVIEDTINELVKFNPFYHVDEPVEMLLLDIVQALEYDESLAYQLSQIIQNKAWEE